VTTDEHRRRHIELHRALDELMCDFMAQTMRVPSDTTVGELLQWSASQASAPTEPTTLTGEIQTMVAHRAPAP
jgi:hypothetical protein